MRCRRLTLEAGPSSVTLRFHPDLTVVAGLGRLERECLAGELLGALSGTRSGATLEVEDDAGRTLAVARPGGDRPDRVLDAATGADVTDAHSAAGRVDLLATVGVGRAEARRRLRVRAADLSAAGRAEELVTLLAGRDQARLWRAAASLRDADRWLAAEAEELGADVEDAELVEEVERRHRAFEAAEARHESIRHHGLFIGGACALGAVPAALLDRAYALPFLAVAVLTTIVSIAFRRRMVRARRAEQRVLGSAGADSYLGFHLARANGLLSGAEQRERLAEAVEHERRAAEAWVAAAGRSVDVEEALALQDRVEAVAAGREPPPAGRDRAGAGGANGDGGGSSPVEELAAVLCERLQAAAAGGRDGESLPLLLDEPLAGLPATDTWELLELVRATSGAQVIYLTEDPEVAAWARAAAADGGLAVVEPAPDAPEDAAVAAEAATAGAAADAAAEERAA